MINLSPNVYDPIDVVPITVEETSADYFVHLYSNEALPSGINISSSTHYYAAIGGNGGHLVVDAIGTVNERCGVLELAGAYGTIENCAAMVESGTRKLHIQMVWHIIGRNRPDSSIYEDIVPFGTIRSRFMFVAN